MAWHIMAWTGTSYGTTWYILVLLVRLKRVSDESLVVQVVVVVHGVVVHGLVMAWYNMVHLGVAGPVKVSWIR